jgi:mono/diheme cytochrome c family protein
VARGELREDDHFYRGIVDGQWATSFPEQMELSEPEAAMRAIRRGKQRFEIYCRPCHGDNGSGHGMVNERAMAVGAQATGWNQPTDLTQDTIIRLPHGQLFNTITYGIRTMPAYGAQIPTLDRWHIVLYLRALQRSRKTTVEDLDPATRQRLQ